MSTFNNNQSSSLQIKHLPKILICFAYTLKLKFVSCCLSRRVNFYSDPLIQISTKKLFPIMNIGTISNVHSFKNVLPQGISMYLSEQQMFPIARYYLLELPKIIP